MILFPVTVCCDEPGCDREFEAEIPFVPPWARPPFDWARSVSPLTEEEFRCGCRWRLPGRGEPTTVPVYCPTHAREHAPEEPA